MIDQAYQTVAEQINYVLIPGLNQVITDVMRNNVFQNMTANDIRVAIIKFYLEAMTLLILIWIGRKIRIGFKKNKSKQTKHRKNMKIVPERKWTPTGWYWDEKKQSWIPPDYLSKESHEKWKWDPEKRIWIDQDPPK